MTIEQQARALMIRHHSMMNNRQQCMLSRAAHAVGLPDEAVQAWGKHQGKARPDRTELDASHVGLS